MGALVNAHVHIHAFFSQLLDHVDCLKTWLNFCMHWWQQGNTIVLCLRMCIILNLVNAISVGGFRVCNLSKILGSVKFRSRAKFIKLNELRESWTQRLSPETEMPLGSYNTSISIKKVHLNKINYGHVSSIGTKCWHFLNIAFMQKKIKVHLNV